MVVRYGALLLVLRLAHAFVPAGVVRASRCSKVWEGASEDEEDLLKLEAAAEAAKRAAEAAEFPRAQPSAEDVESKDEAYFWQLVEEAKLVNGGGAAYTRGRIVDARRADADAAKRRGVMNLESAGDIKWAQTEDAVFGFCPIDDGVRARDVTVSFGIKSLSISIGPKPILSTAPLRHEVDVDACGWTLEVIEGLTRRHCIVELPKLNDALLWASFLDGRTDQQVIDNLESSIAQTDELMKNPDSDFYDPRRNW